MYTKKQRENYNLDRDITCRELEITKNQYNYLRREGAKLHKVYENNCNGLYETEKEYNNACMVPEMKIDKLKNELGLYIYYQTDPRGATIYADKKPIADNAYTNAHCIY